MGSGMRVASGRRRWLQRSVRRRLRKRAVVGSIAAAACLLLAQGAAMAARGPAYRQEIIVAGSPFKGVNGLVLDGRGHLLVGSLRGQKVHSVDLATGAVSTLVGPPLGGADDVALGADGSVYWTRYREGEVMRRTPDGKVQAIASGLPGANSLAFRRDGRLYATQLTLGDALWELDPTGKAAPRKVVDKPGNLNGFEFGPDDKLYGPLTRRNGAIVRIDVDTGRTETVASGGFVLPTGVNFDARRQHLYVVDIARGDLVRVRLPSGETELVAKLPPGLDNLAVGPDDKVYVSNGMDSNISVVDPADGSVRILAGGHLTAPAGVAVAADDPAEQLYVADFVALRQVGGLDGKIGRVDRFLSSTINSPTNVAVSARHVILSGGGTIQVRDRGSDELLRTIPAPNGVQGVLELADGALLAVERDAGRLVRFGAGDPALPTVVAEGLEGPVGLAADRSADAPGVYVTEARSGKVTRVRLSDGARRTVAAGLKSPEGLAVDRSGGLVVAEVGRKRLVRIDPATGRTTVIASGLPIGLPEVPGSFAGYLATGVAVGPSGAIYMTSDVEGALYRFVPTGH